MSGGGVHGARNEFGFEAVKDRVPIHDLHATTLHPEVVKGIIS